MSKILKSVLLGLLILSVGIVLIAGKGGKEEAAPAAVSAIPEPPPVKVNLVMAPVFDMSPLWVAREKGFFEDVNIEVQKGEFPVGDLAFSAKALEVGDVDFGIEGTLTIPTTYCNLTTNVVTIHNENQWWGNMILARSDSGFKTFDDFMNELGDEQKALEAVSRQIIGKKWVTELKTSVDNVIDVVTEAGGFAWDDINFIDMKYAEGAAAFIRGEGDFYSGTAPDNFRVIDLTGAYPILTSRDIPEPSLVWISLWTVRRDWMQDNEDTVLRMIGVWYRVTDLVNSDDWGEVIDLEREWVKKSSGTDFTRERARWIIDNIQPQRTFEDAGQRYYLTPFKGFDNWLQWRLDWDIKFQKKNESIPQDCAVTPEDLDEATRLYKKLQMLKAESEKNIETLESAFSSGDVKDRDLVGNFIEKAKYWHSIRNYVDSEKVSKAGLDLIK